MQYAVAFLEGIITFISPCLLPMLPIYISYFAGGGERSTKKTLSGALGFVSGFTVVFVAMGALAGTIGSILREYKGAVNLISGLIVILFGLNFLGVFKMNLFSTVQSHLRFVDCKNDIHSTVFIYPTILGRQAHAVKQNAIQHLGIGRNIPEPLVREQHLRNSIECE